VLRDVRFFHFGSIVGLKERCFGPPGITKSFAMSLGFRVEGNFGFIDVQITLEIELLSSLVEGASPATSATNRPIEG